MRVLFALILPCVAAYTLVQQPALPRYQAYRRVGDVRLCREVIGSPFAFNDPDDVGTFVSDELASTWERAGKGRALWQPGDVSEENALDARLLWTNLVLKPATLHGYDCCDATTQARLVLGWVQLPHKLQLYGYGAGADPAECGGHGYDPETGGLVPLIGAKAGPVLTGAGVLTREGTEGLSQPTEICSFAVGVAPKLKVAPATGRADIAQWLAAVEPTRQWLVRPRLIRMPVADFEDPRDVAYAQWEHSSREGFDYDEAMEMSPRMLTALAPALAGLDSMLCGRDSTRDNMPTLNAWGLSVGARAPPNPTPTPTQP